MHSNIPPISKTKKPNSKRCCNFVGCKVREHQLIWYWFQPNHIRSNPVTLILAFLALTGRSVFMYIFYLVHFDVLAPRRKSPLKWSDFSFFWLFSLRLVYIWRSEAVLLILVGYSHLENKDSFLTHRQISHKSKNKVLWHFITDCSDLV